VHHSVEKAWLARLPVPPCGGNQIRWRMISHWFFSSFDSLVIQHQRE